MKKRKKKHVILGQEENIELNVMPFVDVFSLLCTFLLFSAVYIKTTFIPVQLPYLSNAVPTKKQEIENNKRTLTLKITIRPKILIVRTKFSQEPIDKQRKIYPLNDLGIKRFHKYLVYIKEKAPSSNKANVYVNKNINYEQLIKVLDQVRVMDKGDKLYSNSQVKNNQNQLFPKIIIANVILV